ncbi:MAG: hypothetical protein GF416_07660 [Candidatus Altiarchaeales archaeon]|nr:hypothetical protein [Candidatus Altiarchaeales archaeon]MBD3416988.1 hypothetical protein [Candidatus Altiarchaeales archaeon]
MTAQKIDVKKGEPLENQIHLLDLGAGTRRGRAYSVALRRHENEKEGRIVEVDILPKEHISDKPPNLEVVQADALEFLRGLEPGSVNVINFDLSLGEASSEGEYRMLYSPPPAETHVKLDRDLGDAMKRALAANGRIFINTSRTVEADLVRELQRQDFKVTVFPFSQIWDKMESKPTSSSEIIQMAGFQNYINHSIQIVARK